MTYLIACVCAECGFVWDFNYASVLCFCMMVEACVCASTCVPSLLGTHASLLLRFVHCRQWILECVIEASGTSKRWMIKACSQPALRDAAVPVHSRQTHHETEQTNHIDVSLLSAWRIREGVSQSDRQSSLLYISIGRIPQMILVVWCCNC